jgi:hypothetical protein
LARRQALVRLGVQVVAAVAVAASLFQRDGSAEFSLTNGILIALAAFAIVWSANLFNFMDGNDGLAALMAVCGFGAYGAAAMRAGSPPDVYLALASATLPFLAANLPPARAFMGDGGSVPLGFLAAVFGLGGIQAEVWPGWFPLLVFLPFIADTLVTMIRRVVAGEDLFQAHKTHYQRLNGCGSRRHVSVLRVSSPGPALRRILRWRQDLRPGGRCSVHGQSQSAVFSPALIIIGADAHQGSDDETPNFRAWLALCHDLAATARLGRDVPRAVQPGFQGALSADMVTLAWILPLQGTIFVAFGLYRGLWKPASLRPAAHRPYGGPRRAADSVVLVMLQLHWSPRSVLIFYPIVLTCGRRPVRVPDLEGAIAVQPARRARRAGTVIGAGEAGARLTREFARSRQARYQSGRRRPCKARTHGAQRHCPGADLEFPGWAKKYGGR